MTIKGQSVLNQGTHYSLAFDPSAMDRWATAAAKELRKAIGEVRPIFCYQGFSGVAHGQAIARTWRRLYGDGFGQCYVRKKAEIDETHGSWIEFCIGDIKPEEKKILAFVDDFVDSGNTRTRTITGAKEYFQGPFFVKNFVDKNFVDKELYYSVTGEGSRSDEPIVEPLEFSHL